MTSDNERVWIRLQPTHDKHNRCSVPVPGRRLPCNRKVAWYGIFKSWAGGNGSCYRCELHKPPVEPTHREGGLPLEVNL